ncbi:MAG: NUDIX domain-containing protein [archaeon]|jgi:8-oxo-dGTP diphosphatase
MTNFSLAAKALIVDKGKILLIKRRLNDPHKPGVWDFPGGRISLEEDPVDGVKREALEEAGLEIEVICPIGTKHFTREDGQVITGINFYCKLKGKNNVKLSEEHTEYSWETIPNAKKKIYHELLHLIENYEKMKSGEMFK